MRGLRKPAVLSLLKDYSKLCQVCPGQPVMKVTVPFFFLFFVITAGTLKTTSVMWLLYFNCLAAVSVSLSCTHTHACTRTYACTHTHTHACMHSHMHVCKYKLSACEYAGFLIPVHPSCGCCNSTA